MPVLDYMAYLAEDACKPGEQPPNCTGMMNGNVTWASDWVHIVNNEIGQWFYGIYHPSGVNSYKSKLQIDIWGADHPLAQIAWTRDLPGWGIWEANHYLASNEYNFYANKVRYGDSAPNSATPHGNPFGWHWRDIDDFYNNHINHGSSYNLIFW